MPAEHYVNHSHKKRKDDLTGCLDRILIAAEHDLLKILVPRLPQNTSLKTKTTVLFSDQPPGELIYLYFFVLILICL